MRGCGLDILFVIFNRVYLIEANILVFLLYFERKSCALFRSICFFNGKFLDHSKVIKWMLFRFVQNLVYYGVSQSTGSWGFDPYCKSLKDDFLQEIFPLICSVLCHFWHCGSSLLYGDSSRIESCWSKTTIFYCYSWFCYCCIIHNTHSKFHSEEQSK